MLICLLNTLSVVCGSGPGANGQSEEPASANGHTPQEAESWALPSPTPNLLTPYQVQNILKKKEEAATKIQALSRGIPSVVLIKIEKNIAKLTDDMTKAKQEVESLEAQIDRLLESEQEINTKLQALEVTIAMLKEEQKSGELKASVSEPKEKEDEASSAQETDEQSQKAKEQKEDSPVNLQLEALEAGLVQTKQGLLDDIKSRKEEIIKKKKDIEALEAALSRAPGLRAKLGAKQVRLKAEKEALKQKLQSLQRQSQTPQTLEPTPTKQEIIILDDAQVRPNAPKKIGNLKEYIFLKPKDVENKKEANKKNKKRLLTDAGFVFYNPVAYGPNGRVFVDKNDKNNKQNQNPSGEKKPEGVDNTNNKK